MAPGESEMKEQELSDLLISSFAREFTITPWDNGFKVILPYRDYLGDPVETAVRVDDGHLVLDDMGHVAGVLFSLGEHTENSPAHQLVRNLANAYQIEMDYDRGILSRTESLTGDMRGVSDFIKVLISLQTVIPELRHRRKERRGRSRLATRLGRDITQLRLPSHVEKRVEVAGRHLSWLVHYKYTRRQGPDIVDVLIVAADLGFKDPRLKAEHVLTLAVDLLETNGRRDLRVVYEVGGNGTASAARSAADLIEDAQQRLKYRAFNYGDIHQKGELVSLTLQELLPLA